MSIVFGDISIEVKEWSNRADLETHLSESQGKVILLGSKTEHPRVYHSYSLSPRWSRAKELRIGVVSEGHGLVPQVLVSRDMTGVLVGFDCELVCIDLARGDQRYRVAADGLIYACTEAEDTSRVLVVHEFGVMCISPGGDVLWSHHTDDLIEDFEIVDEELRITQIDGPPKTVDLASGKIS